MVLTKRHFNAIASIIKSTTNSRQLNIMDKEELVGKLSKYFSEVNWNFKEGRFRMGCGLRAKLPNSISKEEKEKFNFFTEEYSWRLRVRVEPKTFSIGDKVTANGHEGVIVGRYYTKNGEYKNYAWRVLCEDGYHRSFVTVKKLEQ